MTNELMTLDGVRGAITEVGWEVPEGVTQQEADRVLAFASRTNTMTAWVLGDVLANVPQSWGMYDRAMELTGYEKSTLKSYASVAKSVKSLIRVNDLSFKHHRLVAPMPEDDQRYWLGEMKSGGWSVAKSIEEMRTGQIVEQQSAPEFPAGVYPVVYADPPWRYEFSMSPTRDIENQYPTMALEDILALPVGGIAAEDAVLFLWTTSPKLLEGLQVIDAWGFVYKTCMVWDKERMGMGYYARQQHELLLIATRGALPVPDPENRPSSVVRIRRDNEHSVKPHEFYDLIERMYPGLPKIELFARNKRDGWDAWGNEV